MAEVYTNSDRVALATGIDADDTSLTVDDGASLPDGGTFRLALSDDAGNREIVSATDRAGNVVSGLTRAAESAAIWPAQAWSAGAHVEHVLTAAGLGAIVSDAVAGVGGGGGGGGGGLYDAYVQVRDERASGTHGGDYTTGGTWQTRPLQTEKADPVGIASVGSNQITLAAGTYHVQARGATQFSGPARLRLRDITNGVTLVLGDSAGDNAGGGGYTQNDPLELSGRFTLAATTVIELQMWATYSRATYGLGAATSTGDVEVYASVELWREGSGGGGGGGPAYTPPGSMTGWAWDVQAGAAISAHADGWDMTTDAADNNQHAFYRSYPATPFSVIAGIKPPLVGTNYVGAGIGFSQGAGNMFLLYFGFTDGQWYTRVDKWNNYASFGARPFSAVATQRDVLLFKIEDDGTNVKFSIAHDLSYQWQQVYQEARAAWVAAADRLHFHMQGASGGIPGHSRLVHWVVS